MDDQLMLLLSHYMTLATHFKNKGIAKYLQKTKKRVKLGRVQKKSHAIIPAKGPTPLKSMFLILSLIYLSSLLDWSISKITGVPEKVFNDILHSLQPLISFQRKHVLSFKRCLLLSLFKLKHNCSIKVTSALFQVSEPTISRTLRFMMPYVYQVYVFRLQNFFFLSLLHLATLLLCYTRIFLILFLCCRTGNLVKFPSKEEWTLLPVGFCGAQVLIDCSSHLRKRVHPCQQLYYWGDVGGHQLTVQTITDIHGNIIDVVIALGHNNDSGVFNLSGRKDFMEQMNICGLSDRGYNSTHLIRPDDSSLASSFHVSPEMFSTIRARYRSPIEQLFSPIKNFS